MNLFACRGISSKSLKLKIYFEDNPREEKSALTVSSLAQVDASWQAVGEDFLNFLGFFLVFKGYKDRGLRTEDWGLKNEE